MRLRHYLEQQHEVERVDCDENDLTFLHYEAFTSLHSKNKYLAFPAIISRCILSSLRCNVFVFWTIYSTVCLKNVRSKTTRGMD